MASSKFNQSRQIRLMNKIYSKYDAIMSINMLQDITDDARVTILETLRQELSIAKFGSSLF